jgi:hypothetical protein
MIQDEFPELWLLHKGSRINLCWLSKVMAPTKTKVLATLESPDTIRAQIIEWVLEDYPGLDKFADQSDFYAHFYVSTGSFAGTNKPAVNINCPLIADPYYPRLRWRYGPDYLASKRDKAV